MKGAAIGYIVYQLPGETFASLWSVGCVAGESAEDMRQHLAKHLPAARFIGAIIVPDPDGVGLD